MKFTFYHPSCANIMHEIPEQVQLRSYNNAIYAQVLDEHFYLGTIQVPTLDFIIKSWKVFKTTGNIDINIIL